MFSVYKLVVGGEPYFGFTSRKPRERLEEHIKTAITGKWKHNSKLYPILSEFEGDYESFEILGEHEEELPALLQEIAEIHKAGKDNTLNLSNGGEGSTMTVHTKAVNGEVQFKVTKRRSKKSKTKFTKKIGRKRRSSSRKRQKRRF